MLKKNTLKAIENCLTCELSAEIDTNNAIDSASEAEKHTNVIYRFYEETKNLKTQDKEVRKINKDKKGIKFKKVEFTYKTHDEN